MIGKEWQEEGFAASENLTDVFIFIPQCGAEGKRSKYHITLN